MKKNGENYFNWYLDGKRDHKPVPASKKKEQPKAKTGVTSAELFERRDQDGDQRVTWKEYLGDRTGDQVAKIKAAFSKRDRNNDGVWSKDEIK